VVTLAAPRRQRAEFHGGGCLFAALLAGHLALAPRPSSAEAIEKATRKAKKQLTRAILRACDAGDGLLVLPAG
jgi:hydroxymethylpyrimidine/phosphomethylpyrimidine kinase